MTVEREAASLFLDPEITRFPDHPDCPDIATFYYLIKQSYPAALMDHFGNQETTVILSRVAVGAKPNRTYIGVHFPDLLIAFDADAKAWPPRNGYLIPEQGKPPDFVLEIAPVTPSHLEVATQGASYAAMGVGEYWQFYPDRSSYEGAPLSGGRLVSGRYEPIPVIQTGDEQFWGRSAKLNLSICWESDNLRFWDPANSAYIQTFAELVESRKAAEAEAARAVKERIEAEARATEARADAESARARQLEAELRRLRNP